MTRPDPVFLTAERRAELRAEAAATPEWAAWLRLVELSLEAADAPAWRAANIRLAGARPADAPLLEGARIRVDAEAARGLLTGVLGVVAEAPAGSESEVDALAVLEAVIAQDAGRLAGLAARSGYPASVFATAAHQAAQPLLLAATRRCEPMIPAGWTAGYCPVCGAWPALAEVRGLDRTRVLRCGRCAAGWRRDVLHCAYCGERDHRRQGALVPEEGGELLRIETCAGCHGYLKVVTTLGAGSAAALALHDLRSMPLELRARERGYRRPDGPGNAPRVAVSPAGPVPAGGGR